MPSGGLYATYHLLREPETTIDVSQPPNFLGTPNAFGEVGEAPLLGVGAAGEATVASWLELA